MPEEVADPDERKEFLSILLIPLNHAVHMMERLSGAGLVLLNGIRDLARGVCGHDIAVCAFCKETASLYEFSLNEDSLQPKLIAYRIQDLLHMLGFYSDRGLERSVEGIVFLAPSFLLGEQPQYRKLIYSARQRGISLTAQRGSGDIYAVAFRADYIRNRWEYAVSLLRYLTRTMHDPMTDALPDFDDVGFIAPSPLSPNDSPAMAEIQNPESLRTHDAPLYLNTALEELLFDAPDRAVVGNDPVRMRDVLTAQRRISKVPWIFNELLNEIEFNLGSIKPLSIPPEIHLAMTGACNIQCKFCSYTREMGRHDFVTPEKVSRFDVLEYIRTLRLSSGLGEPTLNPHLPAIIDLVAKHFPHIEMNFFTNGILLDRPALFTSLVGKGIQWISVSLNCATPKTWADLSGADHFGRVCRNLKAILQQKRACHSLHPLVYASMVMTRRNLEELPMMPGLCRELGIDRFTAFPFSSFGYGGADKYGEEQAYHHEIDRYEKLYRKTVEEAETHRVSLELPSPMNHKETRFGCEVRPTHDFAGIEVNEWRLGRLLGRLKYSKPSGSHCFFLWRQAGIGSTNRTLGDTTETHYIYPCLGPLSGFNYTRYTPVRFSGRENFMKLWQNPLFLLLRKAQHESRVCEVCDMCRSNDTRDPKIFAEMDKVTKAFVRTHGLNTVEI